MRASGNCTCGRKQDRINPQTGQYLFTCSVCSERQEAARARAKISPPGGVTGRDEAKRVLNFQNRVRDRKNEMRIETLLEVRKAWQNSRNVGLFTKWLEEQIKASMIPRTG